MPVKVFSGIAPPQALLDAMAAASLKPGPTKLQSSLPAEIGTNRPPMPPRPSGERVPVNSGDEYADAPPSYEDAMADNLSPVDGPRREYHPPEASQPVGPGTDVKSVAHGKDPEEALATEGFSAPRRRDTRSSSESFDMLPTTPPESHSGSPPPSPTLRPSSIMKIPRNSVVDGESPPQYEPAGTPGSSSTQRQPSRTHRPMNLGVPNRKPVPRSPDTRGH